MDYVIPALPFAFVMSVGMLICLEIGRRLGKCYLVKDPQGAMSGIGVVQGAVFSLFGLLIAFTFNGGPSRLDARRKLIQSQANAIGTAYSRVDLLPPESQPAMREYFREYVDSQLQIFRQLPDVKSAQAELSRSATVQAAIWRATLEDTRLRGANPDAPKLLIPAVNDMFDVSASRILATRNHPPVGTFALLFLLSLVCSIFAGYSMAGSKQRNWLHITAFALVFVISVFVSLEMEYPRTALLPVESAYDQVLVDLRASMR